MLVMAEETIIIQDVKTILRNLENILYKLMNRHLLIAKNAQLIQQVKAFMLRKSMHTQKRNMKVQEMIIPEQTSSIELINNSEWN